MKTFKTFAAVLAAVLVTVLVTGTAHAGPVRHFIAQHRPGILVPKGHPSAPVPSLAVPAVMPAKPACPGGQCPLPKTKTLDEVSAVLGVPATAAAGPDALDEVNAARAARGLKPFARDEALTRAAAACAADRAARGLFGHTANDFAYLPAGATCRATGCAAYPPHMGWLSCCTYEPYAAAGAAWVLGYDGKRYMSLFVK